MRMRVAVFTILSACAPETTGALAPGSAVADPRPTGVGPLSVTGKVVDSTVHVTVSRLLACDGSPCGEKKILGSAVVWRMGPVSSRQLSDADGHASFNLETWDSKLNPPDGGTIVVVDVNGESKEVHLSLEGSDAYKVLRAAFEKPYDDALREDEARERDEDALGAEQTTTGAPKLIAKLEGMLRRLRPPFNQTSAREFRSARQIRAAFPESIAKEHSRDFALIDAAMRNLAPQLEPLVRKLEADLDRAVIEFGRERILSAITRPEEPSFSDESILLHCPNGFVVTRHHLRYATSDLSSVKEVTACPKFDIPGRKQIVSAGDDAVMRIDGQCSDAVIRPDLTKEEQCARWAGWKWKERYSR